MMPRRMAIIAAAVLILASCGRSAAPVQEAPRAGGAQPAGSVTATETAEPGTIAIGTSGAILARSGSRSAAAGLPREIWRYQGGAPATTITVTIGDVVVAGYADFTFRAVNTADGTLKWLTERDALPVSVAVSSAGLFAADMTSVSRLAPDDGAGVWSVSAGVAPGARLLATSRAVYVPLTDGRITALDAETGETMWTADVDPTAASPLSGAMSAVDGILYATSADGALGAVGANDGARRWTAYLPAPALGGTTIVSGKAYGCTANGVVFRANLQSGDWVAITTVGEPVIAAVVPGAGKIFVFGAAGGVYAVDPDAEGFDLPSDSELEDPSTDHVPQPASPVSRMDADLAGQPGLMESLVLTGNARGLLVAVDATSGRTAWSSPIQIIPTLGFAYDGSVLYAIGTEGRIVALALDVPADTTPLLGSDRIWELPAGGAFRMDSRFVEFRFVPKSDGVIEWSVASSDPSDELIVTLRDSAGTVVATNMGKVMLEKSARATVTAGREWRIRVERTYPDRSAIVTLSSRFIR